MVVNNFTALGKQYTHRQFDIDSYMVKQVYTLTEANL